MFVCCFFGNKKKITLKKSHISVTKYIHFGRRLLVCCFFDSVDVLLFVECGDRIVAAANLDVGCCVLFLWVLLVVLF